MKKTSRFIFFSFMLSFLFIFAGSMVSASSDFWTIAKDFSVSADRKDDGTVYTFNEEDGKDEDYNYSFNYDYMIQTEQPLVANGVRVTRFYGVHGSVNITYTNVQDFWNPYADVFTAYKYNYITHEFDTNICNQDHNADIEGTCVLEGAGVYRVMTSGRGDGNSRDVYILIQEKFQSYSLESITVNKAAKSLVVDLLISDPREIDKCGTVLANIPSLTTFEVDPSCSVSLVNEQVGRYKLQMVLKIPTSYEFAKNNDLSIRITTGNIPLNVLNFANVLNYDVKKPNIIGDRVYSNSELATKDIQSVIGLEGGTIKIAPKSKVEFLVQDNSRIEKVSVNNRSCTIGNNVSTISTIYTVNSTCFLDSELDNGMLVYSLEDSHGNVTTFTQAVSYDEAFLPSEDNLQDHIIVDETGVKVSFDTSLTGYEDIDKACLFYGEIGSINDATCISDLTTTSKITSEYHFRGKAIVIVVDKVGNFGKIEVEDAYFAKGYAIEDYIYNANTTDALDVSGVYNELMDMACDVVDSTCYNKGLLYAKYGDYIELLDQEDMTLPTYLEILNKKFKDNACALGACDKQVELQVVYKIGNVEQTISAYYNYIDDNPQIKSTTEQPFTINDTVTLEYKSFNISSDAIIQSLYGDNLSVNLVSRDDPDTVIYQGVISPIFVSYKDRNGNVSLINDESYGYISTVNEFGYYALECRIKLTRDVVNGTDITEEQYAKSFFVTVELKDSVKPTLSLVGDSEVTVKQYDVYKDAGTKCSDLSTCRVEVTYYLNDETNQVDKIDTDIAGKYIIKYVAIDGDGNESFPTYRYVDVVALTSLDTTSIIVIAAVVGLFVIFVVVGIVNIKKKSRRLKEEE